MKLGPVIASLSLGLAVAAAQEPSQRTVHLHGGATIHGWILQKTPDRVVIDLGYTVLNVPTAQVERIDLGDAGDPGSVVPAAGANGLLSAVAGRRELTVKENIARCGEAVVQVRSSIGLGSGFLIHADGYVVTSHHVIAGEQDLTVTLFRQGERELRRVQYTDVRIVATSPHTDLALLKIDAAEDPLPSVPLGDSAEMRQGQTVFAIGSPLGLERSVSQGIVSLKNRTLGGHIYIQSTTQINPGNSGGPLFNLRGEVIGVNNMKISMEGIEGLAFAVPSASVRSFLANRDAFAFDPRNPNAGFRYNQPPRFQSGVAATGGE